MMTMLGRGRLAAAKTSVCTADSSAKATSKKLKASDRFIAFQASETPAPYHSLEMVGSGVHGNRIHSTFASTPVFYPAMHSQPKAFPTPARTARCADSTSSPRVHPSNE